MNWGIPKFKIWHDVKHIAVLSNLNASMSRITVIENKSYLNWSIFELRIEFLFSFFTAHILLVNMNILFNMNVLLCLPFTRHIWKAIFLPLEKLPWYVPAKYSETNNTEHCPRRNEKCISYIHFVVNFCILAKFLFSHNFHNFIFSADSKNNLLG